MFDSDGIVKNHPLHVQIRDSLRAAICSGQLSPGMRIPSSQQLCQTYQTGASVVQMALAALTEEGLIERKRGAGSFVKGNAVRLCKVGLYYYSFFWTDGGMDFYRLVYGHLHTLLEREHIRCRPFIGAYSKDRDQKHFPRAIRAAAASGEIQALLCPLISGVTPDAYEELEVPVISLSRYVRYDHEQMLDLACAYLAQQGCRTLGAILTVPAQEMQQSLREVAQRYGLRIPDGAVVVPSHPPTHDELGEFGYQAVGELFRNGQLPDGLFVYPDSIAAGVAMGVMNRGFRVPENLKIVLHKNAGVSVFMPFPVASVVSCPLQTAVTMLDIARRKVAGENPEAACLPFWLETPEQA